MGKGGLIGNGGKGALDRGRVHLVGKGALRRERVHWCVGGCIGVGGGCVGNVGECIGKGDCIGKEEGVLERGRERGVWVVGIYIGVGKSSLEGTELKKCIGGDGGELGGGGRGGRVLQV